MKIDIVQPTPKLLAFGKCPEYECFLFFGYVHLKIQESWTAINPLARVNSINLSTKQRVFVNKEDMVQPQHSSITVREKV
jgi:hypothetical protein